MRSSIRPASATRQALTGFLRPVTQPRIIPTPLPADTAPRVVDEWLSHPRARTVEPTDRHAALLARLLIGAGRAGNLVGSRPAA